mmetsp:Transcript_66197/g.158327  ORF Transcript_66197/g.158327 Transcript_66197/m.158327 type:complete len:436 (-) Transcript_66197:13-1320(-)
MSVLAAFARQSGAVARRHAAQWRHSHQPRLLLSRYRDEHLHLCNPMYGMAGLRLHGDSHHGGHGHHDHHGHEHGHGHSHEESNALELAQLKGEALKITAFGFGFNVLLGGIQVWAGLYCNSAGLLSDGFHTVGDSGSDIATFMALRYMQKAPKNLWPYGPGKCDSLAALSVAGVLFTSGGTALLHSLQMLVEAVGIDDGLMDMLRGHTEEHHGHSHDSHGHGLGHGHGHGGAVGEGGFAGQLALATCLLTMGGKEGLYRITASIAKRTGSSLLMANAMHHRSDALSSCVVLAGLLGRIFFHSAFDPLAGSIVAGYIIRMSWGIGARAVRELLDRQLPPSTIQVLKGGLQDAVSDWPEDNMWRQKGLLIEGVDGRRAGPELHLLVQTSLSKSSWSDVTAREVAELERVLLQEMRAREHPAIVDVRVKLGGVDSAPH